MPWVARVALASANYSIDKPYDYLVPDELTDAALPGCRVLLPFGAGNKATEGMILSVGDSEPQMQLKTLTQVLDTQPVLDPAGIKLALWMRERCFCCLYDVIRAMLPTGLLYKTKEKYVLSPGMDKEMAYEAAAKGPKRQNMVLDVLFANGGECTPEQLAIAFDGVSPSSAVKELEKKGVIVVEAAASRLASDKTTDIVSLAIAPEEAAAYAAGHRKTAPLQAAILETLAVVGEASAKELCYFTGASANTIKSLIRREMISSRQVETFRRPQVDSGEVSDRPELSKEQKAAYDGLKALMFSGKAAAALLHGVTGSGKTQVYISLIYDVLSKNRSAIVLTPEISLTPQLMKLFSAHFGDSVAILHSSLRTAERYDEWKRIRSGAARVVVGTRSAVFAPVQRLGLIIVDEEHEQTYKSETTPRYHARDVAKYRCAKENALLLLGSATPSVETMYNAQGGVYSLFRLQTRYNRQDLPRVLIADMKKEAAMGNVGSIGSVLAGEIEKNLDRGEQTILFLNRRGTSRMVLCSGCGYVPECDRCSVKLTYHQANGRLMCHYCGRSTPIPANCPKCGRAFHLMGFGTQHLEEELEERFPGVRVIRMDADSVSSANTHEKILSRFESEAIPILVGTQMVSKGLDFENVTLVGVIDADLSLSASSYRANERTFSQITQVVGRAGRGDKEGRAVIQTMTPMNNVLYLAATQDYDGFYDEEINFRQLLRCPPFCDHIVLTFSGLSEDTVEYSARMARAALGASINEQGLDAELIGPAVPPVARVNNRYRYRLTVFCKNDRGIRSMIEQFIKQFSKNKINKGVLVFADVNPFD